MGVKQRVLTVCHDIDLAGLIAEHGIALQQLRGKLILPEFKSSSAFCMEISLESILKLICGVDERLTLECSLVTRWPDW